MNGHSRGGFRDKETSGWPAWWEALLRGPGPGTGRPHSVTLMCPAGAPVEAGGPFLPDDTMASRSRFAKGSASPRCPFRSDSGSRQARGRSRRGQADALWPAPRKVHWDESYRDRRATCSLWPREHLAQCPERVFVASPQGRSRVPGPEVETLSLVAHLLAARRL